jgi:hypothetical protein
MGGQPWPSSRFINGGMASSRERKGRGKGKGKREMGHRCGAPWGEGGLQGGTMGRACGLPVVVSSCSVRENMKQEGEEEKEERIKREEKKRKERKEKKKYGIFSKLEKFWGEK